MCLDLVAKEVHRRGHIGKDLHGTEIIWLQGSLQKGQRSSGYRGFTEDRGHLGGGGGLHRIKVLMEERVCTRQR